MGILRDIIDGHERLKHKIHNTRIPLSLRGQRFMGLVYFGVPVVCGYFIMTWTMNKSEQRVLHERQAIEAASSATTRKYTSIQNDQLKAMLSKIQDDSSSEK